GRSVEGADECRERPREYADLSGSTLGEYCVQVDGAAGGGSCDRSDSSGLGEAGERSFEGLFGRRHHRCDGHHIVTVRGKEPQEAHVLFVPLVVSSLIRHAAHARLSSAATAAAGAITHRGFHTVAAARDGEY